MNAVFSVLCLFCISLGLKRQVSVSVQEEVCVAPPEPAAIAGHHPSEGHGVRVPIVQALRPPGGHRYPRGWRLWTSRTGET